ncbi:MAG: fasciclin domain-containing protein [Calditrichaeota bacterium]|nr:MAG: fasciclin domain-containing protein [Calditrichota bacterium]MBL1206054.1 fasciclin domain-containing protein [Calditrichota bacterium]NOG45881.1 fasciclin domain-containing protein [Calditrichota bacterium]
MKTIFIVLFSFALILSSCKQTESNAGGGEDFEKNTPLGQASVVDEESAKNILQLAIATEDLSTLVAAVQAAQIEHVLVNAGPLTVFAPVNSAFDALPEGTVATLLKPENKKKLAFILTNHASPSTYKGRLLKDGRKLYMATGEYIEIKREGEDIFIGGAKILATVDASNGVVHLIDKVLVPAEK